MWLDVLHGRCGWQAVLVPIHTVLLQWRARQVIRDKGNTKHVWFTLQTPFETTPRTKLIVATEPPGGQTQKGASGGCRVGCLFLSGTLARFFEGKPSQFVGRV